MYKDVVPEFEKIPEVVECHITTGPYTLLIKLYARDNEHLMELLNSRIQEIPGVTATETLISLRQSVKREIPITHLMDCFPFRKSDCKCSAVCCNAQCTSFLFCVSYRYA